MDFLTGIGSVLEPMHLLLLVGGVIIGLIFGTIPGLSGITAVALLVPFSYVLGAEAAIIMMIGVYVATSTAGSLAGSLFNMPGDVMGAATARDGYPLTLQGQAGRAISMDITASAVGGLIGTLLLVMIAPQFLRIALRFGPPEFFALAILGMTSVASLAMGSLVKALLAGTFGLLMATVGLDPVSGAVRFVFGVQPLQGGIDFIPAIIGFFAVAEIFHALYYGTGSGGYTKEDIKKVPRFALPSLADLKWTWKTMIRASLIGNFIGMLPGAGSTVAAFLGYGTEVQISKDKSKFGKGEIRGVVAPESANNAAAAGSMVPLLTLGIPGGAVTAIMLGVFILNGLRPGPLLFRDAPEIASSVFGALFMASVVVLITGLLLVRVLLRLLTIPFEIFSTMVLVFAVIGTFAIFNRPIDLWIMLVCGVLGFFAKQYEFPVSALVLGLVLGDIAEIGLVNGLNVTRGSWSVFFTRPFTTGTMGIAFVLLLLPVFFAIRRKRNAETDEPVSEQLI
ncbi:MAG: tripartite tricarboxylate transporter permease [Actinobacteria bacterium]|jgi:putative tricarboxylic transport membrane protein|nr:tripartite tricarboxylate transporter permease [Actinomycetota bacterium]